MNPYKRIAILGLLILLLSACASDTKTQYLSKDTLASGKLSAETLRLNASTPPLQVSGGSVITDNDAAFEHKLAMVENAKHSIDLAYYIFADDYSSSTFTQALMEAAQRGVRVRMLLDYHENYQRLDWYSMMEHYSNQGTGSLQVRFYNRPTKNIIKDAVFMTMGCGEAQTCGEAKFAKIEQLFSNERINGLPVANRNISNLNSYGSGLLLSGFYGQKYDLMALAITKGQNIELSKLLPKSDDTNASGETLAKFKKLAKIYWQSRSGITFERIQAKIKLATIFALYGEQLKPIYEAITGYLPLGKRENRQTAQRDWNYLTDFLHHKFLWVDKQKLQIGGRNVEDSYHTAPNPLLKKYLFMDTDVNLQLASKESTLTQSFEKLWNFDLMIASIKDIRQHAPNDFLKASQKAETLCKDATQAQHCQEQAIATYTDLAKRLAEQYQQMLTNASTYRNSYQSVEETQRSPQFIIDPKADVYYVENLPFEHLQKDKPPVRHYGSTNGLEGEHGKYIHNLWLSALRNTCQIATATQPQRVIMHNAYFFLPSNLLRQFRAMVNGELDCQHVHVMVLTNSEKTTDLSIINIAARYSLKAFSEYYVTAKDSKRGAQFSYYEHLPQNPLASLHSKVEVFGQDIFIGSANADVRSYIMDSNNGLFIRNAPKLIAKYTAWLDDMLADPTRVENRTQYFLKTNREKMLIGDKLLIKGSLQKLIGEFKIDESHSKQLESSLGKLLDTIYELTMNILMKDEPRYQQDFNNYFKLL
jgi:putative cardiolipin synthase